MSGRLRIFYYHLISEKDRSYYLKNNYVTPSNFRNQIKYITRRFNLITLNDALEMTRIGEKFTNEAVITTDDGFSGNFQYLAPILTEYKGKATLFLNEKSLDNDSMIWRHVLFELVNTVSKNEIFFAANKVASMYSLPRIDMTQDLLTWSLLNIPMNVKDDFCLSLWNEVKKKPINEFVKEEQIYLNSDQVTILLNQGFEIGCHTKSHPLCDVLTDSEVHEEIIESKKRLQQKFSTEIRSFSFPFGRSKRITNILKSNNVFDIVLGIREDLNGQKDPLQWERVCCDCSFLRSLLEIELRPLINHLSK